MAESEDELKSLLMNRDLRAFISCMAWRAITGPLSKRKRRLDSLEAAQRVPRDPRRVSRGERSAWLPLETRPDSPGEPGMQPRSSTRDEALLYYTTPSGVPRHFPAKKQLSSGFTAAVTVCGYLGAHEDGDRNLLTGPENFVRLSLNGSSSWATSQSQPSPRALPPSGALGLLVPVPTIPAPEAWE